MAMKMKAAVFVEPGRIVLDDKPIPDVGPLDALMRVTTTTICGTDVHILKGEYPVARGLTVGHEPVGVIEKLGSAVKGYREGQRVIAGAITPSGWSNACLCGSGSQDGAGTAHGWKPLGGWRLGNTIDGCQAEYVLVPDAMVNLAPVPDELSDEQVLIRAYVFHLGGQTQRREGSFWLDFFNFKRTTAVAGWRFDGLVVVRGELVVFRNFGGEARIDRTERQVNPLGPLQRAGDAVGARILN